MPDHEPSDPTARLNAAHDSMARLQAAFIKAGWLVDMEVVGTVWGYRIRFPKGLGLDQVEELVQTVEAGIETRVIGK